ncbi:hypothetical protein GW17_00027832 [Ensete ventricosum]|nr:hypothetical protein GW17_00027832 [Ensete ventricosum]RZS10629.1 hypothetical protein BHM03_00041881 [Ensete ventricosum]
MYLGWMITRLKIKVARASVWLFRILRRLLSSLLTAFVAQEFKLNPNAKSFTPSSSVRLHAAVPDGSFYQASNVNAVQHMHGLPPGMGVRY